MSWVNSRSRPRDLARPVRLSRCVGVARSLRESCAFLQRVRGSHAASIALVASGVVVLGFAPCALFATEGAAEHAQATLRPFRPELEDRGATGSRGAAPEPAAPSVTTTTVGRDKRVGRVVPLGTALASLSVPSAGIADDVVVQCVDAANGACSGAWGDLHRVATGDLGSRGARSVGA
jgi:hypothetical protein